MPCILRQKPIMAAEYTSVWIPVSWSRSGGTVYDGGAATSDGAPGAFPFTVSSAVPKMTAANLL